jgi:gluconate 2-dehydrogenase alpha chain
VADRDCDAVIVGSGPAGATVADVLTAAGWSVIILEKGRNHLLQLEPPYGPLGHFSNDDIKYQCRYMLGPDPLIEPRAFRREEGDGDDLLLGDCHAIPSTVGGGGVHADGKVPRLRSTDFALRSTLGPVDGADVVDWPVTYDELEPYYTAVEYGIGVAGEETNPFAEWRSAPFPMPPGADMFGAVLSSAAAEARGLHPYRAPTAVNSVPFDGRPACNNCGFCGHQGCAIEAKGDPLALLRRALRTGRCEIRPESYVCGVTLDAAARRATGVRYLDAERVERHVRADHVVLAAGAFETPRLLLIDGLANSSGLVGRNLMFHFQTLTVGAFAFDVWGSRGRAVTHAHDDFIDGDAASAAAARDTGLPFIRGGLVEHGGGGTPVMEASSYPTGPAHTASMIDSALRRRMWVFTLQAEDLAQPTNRIDLHPRAVDAWGRPVGRMTYMPHLHEVVTSKHYGPIQEQILRDAGAEWAFSTTTPPLGPVERAREHGLGLAPASYHIMGTCRMGDDAATSVVDPLGHFWDVENLLCADSSVFATSAGYNPTLTICALAHRMASHLAGEPLAATHPYR